MIYPYNGIYSTIKMNKVLTEATRLMKLENLMVC